jgi:putative ABC transport system substrate-binding protein
MRRREFITLIGAVAAAPFAAMAQKRLAVIGFMGSGAAETSAHLLNAIVQGLRENGLIVGKDVQLVDRWAEGHYERFSAFARELSEKGAHVIIVTTIAGARAAQQTTSVIPIVMASMNDPVGNGLVASLARPGGNTTGMASLNQDLTPKLVEFLRAALPDATNAAVLFNPTNPSNAAYFENVRLHAVPRGITVQGFALSTPDKLDETFVAIAEKRPDVLLVIPDAATLDLGTRLAALSLKHRIPILSTDSDLTSVGGLISYGISRRENYRRSAYFVKRILDGASPADLPVEQPTRVRLSVNLKTAKELGVTLPPSLLSAADEVIE